MKKLLVAASIVTLASTTALYAEASVPSSSAVIMDITPAPKSQEEGIVDVSSSSSSRLTAEELADKITVTRTAAKAIDIAPEPQEERSWWGSIRHYAGSAVMYVGDWMRASDESMAGTVGTVAREGAAKAATAELEIPVPAQVFAYAGNLLRYAGKFIRGGDDNPEVTRTVVNSLGLTPFSDERDVEKALTLAAKASVIAERDDKDNSYDPYDTFADIAKGLQRRGYSTSKMDYNAIYLEALAEQELKNLAPGQSYSVLVERMKLNGNEALGNIPAVRTAPYLEKPELMDKYLEQVLKNAQLKAQKEQLRKSAPGVAAPAA